MKKSTMTKLFQKKNLSIVLSVAGKYLKQTTTACTAERLRKQSLFSSFAYDINKKLAQRVFYNLPGVCNSLPILCYSNRSCRRIND